MKQSDEALARAAGWAGINLQPAQTTRLLDFGTWLVDEAIPAGGLGPDEESRLVDRHLADALVLARPWGVEAPETLLDVGSGVGLPGIPLAIAYPRTEVTLLDRAGRRIELAKRAVRVLGLDNVRTIQQEVSEHATRYPAVTMRAAMPVEQAVAVAGRLLLPKGIAMIALSREGVPGQLPSAQPGVDLEVVRVPNGVLDSPAWHLRMSTT